MARKKKARKKAKPLRQSWRDLVSWWTGQKAASAKRAKQKVGDAKTRAKAADDKAAARAERDRLKAEARAKRDAQRAAEQQAATERAQQRDPAQGEEDDDDEDDDDGDEDLPLTPEPDGGVALTEQNGPGYAEASDA